MTFNSKLASKRDKLKNKKRSKKQGKIPSVSTSDSLNPAITSLVVNNETVCMRIDNKEVVKSLERFVMQDIREFGKPAIGYNYHHKIRDFNTFDREEDLKIEFDNLTRQGFVLKTFEKELTIRRKSFSYQLVIATRPGEENTLPTDPLGSGLGYLAPGYYYVTHLKEITPKVEPVNT